jgi:hypothetical protein
LASYCPVAGFVGRLEGPDKKSTNAVPKDDSADNYTKGGNVAENHQMWRRPFLLDLLAAISPHLYKQRKAARIVSG